MNISSQTMNLEFEPRQIYRDLSDIISLHTKMFGVQPTACYLPSK